MKKKRLLRVIFPLLAALIMIVAGGVYLACEVKLTEITVTGNSYYSDEELIAIIFPEEKYYRTLYCILNYSFGEREDIPFIKSYDITLTGPNSVEIQVYEKSMVGYISYMGNYLYFDSEGYIVETSTQEIDELLYIEGISFSYYVLNGQLQVEDPTIFDKLLTLSKLINQEEIEVESVYIDRDLNITLYVGDISVYLGQGTQLETKLNTLFDILPNLSGEQGTLYLDSYSTVNDVVEYFFKRDASAND